MNHKIHSALSAFLPDLHHLPSSHAAKNALFFLGIFGFASMFYAEANASVNIDTSLSNNVMTIQQLLVKDSNGTWKIDLSNLGVKLNLGTPVGVLKRDTNGYIVQGLVKGGDIDVNTIDGTKLQSGAITNSTLATNAITNTNITPGTITCDKLNIPGFSCSTTAANGSCPAGTFLQGISSNGTFNCASISSGGSTSGTTVLPSCNAGETLVYSGGAWSCSSSFTQNSSANSGASLWSSLMNKIYNKNSTGNVGIGISTPTATLTVSGTMLISGLGVPSTATGLAVADPTAILYVGGGKVGILTKNPEYALDVVGTIRAAQVLTTSDKRLKTDIVPVADALDKLMKMNGYTYTLKLDGSSQYGVLAQEVETLFPYLVSTDKNGYKAVNYNGLIAPIIESLHTLNTKINNVQKLNESNEQRIKALENKLNK